MYRVWHWLIIGTITETHWNYH